MNCSSSGCICWLCFPIFVLAEKPAGHNPIASISFVITNTKLGETLTSCPSQNKISEELDYSAYDNLLRRQNSSRERTRLLSLYYLYHNEVPAYPQPPFKHFSSWATLISERVPHCS